jgi:hypothetical protein
VLHVHDIRLLVVPHYETLSVSRSFNRVLEFYPDLQDYFPIYSAGYIPPRNFFWEVFGTLYFEDAKRFIDEERYARYQSEENDKQRSIKVQPEFLKALEEVNYFSKKKGRALYMQSEKAPHATPTAIKRRQGKHQNGLSPFSMELDNPKDNREVKNIRSEDSGSEMNMNLSRKRRASKQKELMTPKDKRQKLISANREQYGFSAD